jgi:hypothetical protein
MATTVGFVQKLVINDAGNACVFIGPAPANTALFLVQPSAGDTPARVAFKASIIDGLTTAMTNRQQVQVDHGDADSNIFGLTLGPG